MQTRWSYRVGQRRDDPNAGTESFCPESQFPFPYI